MARLSVQTEDFDVAAEIARMTAGRTDIGGIGCFVGVVRADKIAAPDGLAGPDGPAGPDGRGVPDADGVPDGRAGRAGDAVPDGHGVPHDRAGPDGRGLRALTLEHYPAMTLRAIARIAGEAERRWTLLGCTVIHRVGRMEPGDNIVLVLTAAAHRQAALDSTAFLIDWLKTRAPFWKREEFADGEGAWVEARETDDAAAARWGATPSGTDG